MLLLNPLKVSYSENDYLQKRLILNRKLAAQYLFYKFKIKPVKAAKGLCDGFCMQKMIVLAMFWQRSKCF